MVDYKTAGKVLGAVVAVGAIGGAGYALRGCGGRRAAEPAAQQAPSTPGAPSAPSTPAPGSPNAFPYGRTLSLTDAEAWIAETPQDRTFDPSMSRVRAEGYVDTNLDGKQDSGEPDVVFEVVGSGNTMRPWLQLTENLILRGTRKEPRYATVRAPYARGKNLATSAFPGELGFSHGPSGKIHVFDAELATLYRVRRPQKTVPRHGKRTR